MNKQEFSAVKKKVTSYVEARRLRDAFRLLRQLSEKKLTWEITDEINRVEESYTLMLHYAMQGADDPSRADVYEDIRSKVLSLLDRIERESFRVEQSTLYYNEFRFEETHTNETLSSLISKYVESTAKLSDMNMTMPDAPGRKLLAKQCADLEHRVFKRVWVSYPLRSDDVQAIIGALRSDVVPAYFRRLLLSAVLLGGLQFHDEARLLILMDGYDSPDMETHSTALVGMLLLMYTYRDRRLSPKVVNRLAALREQPGWRENLRTAFLELIRTRDTDRLTRKLREEVVPEMMKLRPEITRKISEVDPDSLNPELNPEWQERPEKSGIADKLKELSEIQDEGGDIYMATFGPLKQFPFFSEISNWFIPFVADNPALDSVGPEMAEIVDLVTALPALCDSDKYSFVLSLGNLPQAQRDMLSQQLHAQSEHFEELRRASMSLPSADRKTAINNYVKNLFRFFRLFRRKDEFVNPLDTKLNLTAIPALVDDFNDEEILRVVGEFYFTREFYADAFEVFKLIEDSALPSAELFQKMGYCRQQLGDLAGALDFYEKAELLDAKNKWTIRRLAQTNKLLGNADKALSYYQQLELLTPDKLSVALNIGHCLVALERYSDALKAYRKVEYLDEKGSRHLRPIAWCLFMTRHFDQASTYYDRLLATGASASDYLNMGHLNLAMGKFQEAMNFYNMNVETRSDGIDAWIADMHADTNFLEKVGVSPALVPLVIDAVLYTRK